MKRNFRVEIQENYLPEQRKPRCYFLADFLERRSWSQWRWGEGIRPSQCICRTSVKSGFRSTGWVWPWLTLLPHPYMLLPPPPAMHAHTNFTLQGPTQPWIISSRPSGTCSTASLSTTRTLAAASRLYTTSCSLPPNVGLCVCVCVFMSHANPWNHTLEAAVCWAGAAAAIRLF